MQSLASLASRGRFLPRLSQSSACSTTATQLALIHTTFGTNSADDMFRRRRHRGRRLPRDLQLFQDTLADGRDHEEGGGVDYDVHLNPASHWVAVNNQQMRMPKSDGDPTDNKDELRSLSVSVLGVPNAGKSTLINKLCGFAACPYSSKTHTTRTAGSAIITRGTSQVVFGDTPGVVSRADAEKFKLKGPMVDAPTESCTDADLLLVVQDVSNRYVREALNKDVLRLLCRHATTPSILVLNKMDTIPASRRVYNLIRKLTCNRLDGEVAEVKVADLTHLKPRHTAESYLRTREKRKLRKEEMENNQSEFHFHSATDFLHAMREREWKESELDEALSGVVGWPGFREVFTVSAKDGTGLDDLREYLLSSACEASNEEVLSPELRTLDDPRSLALNTVRAKLLEELPGDVAYALTPKLEAWEVDGGCLRIGVLIDSKKPRQTQFLLGMRGGRLKEASRAAEADLQDFFRCDVFLHLNVVVKHKPAATRVQPQDTPTLGTYL